MNKSPRVRISSQQSSVILDQNNNFDSVELDELCTSGQVGRVLREEGEVKEKCNLKHIRQKLSYSHL